MEKVAPDGPVYQAGTLSGNPLAMRAGYETLQLTEAPGFYERLEEHAARLAAGLEKAASDAGVPVRMNRVGAMLCGFFNDAPVVDWTTASRSDGERYATWFRELLDRGVYVAPSQYEAMFVSGAHTVADIDATVNAAAEAFAAVAAG